MKNLLIYINPRKDFDEKGKVTVKIQIDNSLDLGWEKDDILLVTNFPYQYGGVESIVISDDTYCTFDPLSTKTYTIPNLFEQTRIKKGEIYWAHDLDVFQNVVIPEAEIESEMGTADLGLTDKGRMPRWNGGSLFFKETARDIFGATKEIGYKYETTDEVALMVLATNNLLWATEPEPEETIGDRIVEANIPGMKHASKRIKKINITYNFRMWNIRSTYPMAVKPIRAVHFNPLDTLIYDGIHVLDFFMYGKNKINVSLMSERLIKIFHKHGI